MRCLATIAVLVGLAGCVTPSIPIPPPDPAKMTFHLSIVDTKSVAVFQYGPDQSYIGGVAYVYNLTKGNGVIQNCNPDGSVGPTLPFPAEAGNQVEVSVQTGTQTQSTCIVLREGSPDPTQYCQ
jgi:hypothetical protein